MSRALGSSLATMWVVAAAAMLGCDKSTSAVEAALARPSVENGRRLFAADPDAVAGSFSRLPVERQQEWAVLLENHAAEMRAEGQAVGEYCAVAKGLSAIPEGTSKWRLVLSMCDRLAVALVDLATVRGRKDDEDRALREAEGDLQQALAERKAAAAGATAIVRFDGFVIQRLGAGRYEVAEAVMSDAPARPCYGEADCNAAEFSRMAGTAAMPATEHAILETTSTDFTSGGRFTMWVRAKGRERLVDNSGFTREVVVLEEVDETPISPNAVVRNAEAIRELQLRFAAARVRALEAEDGTSLVRARVDLAAELVEMSLSCIAGEAAACIEVAEPGPSIPADDRYLHRYAEQFLNVSLSDVRKRHRRLGVPCNAMEVGAEHPLVCGECEGFPTKGCVRAAFFGDPSDQVHFSFERTATVAELRAVARASSDWSCKVPTELDPEAGTRWPTLAEACEAYLGGEPPLSATILRYVDGAGAPTLMIRREAMPPPSDEQMVEANLKPKGFPLQLRVPASAVLEVSRNEYRAASQATISFTGVHITLIDTRDEPCDSSRFDEERHSWQEVAPDHYWFVGEGDFFGGEYCDTKQGVRCWIRASTKPLADTALGVCRGAHLLGAN